MPAKLDRSRPYGTVHGGDGTGPAFMQDGKEFDNRGVEMVGAENVSSAETEQTEGAAITRDAQGNLIFDGQVLDTESMTPEQLHALAKLMGLRMHHNTGRSKMLIAITQAAGPVDQLAAQLEA